VDSTDEKKTFADYFIAVLDSRKAEAKNLADRQNLLLAFWKNCGTSFFDKRMQDEGSDVTNFFLDLQKTAGNTKRTRERAWNGKYVAHKIMKLHKLILENEKILRDMHMRKSSRSAAAPRKEPAEVVQLRAFMKNVEARAHSDQTLDATNEDSFKAPKAATAANKKRTLKPGEQKGEPIQTFLEWNEHKNDGRNCPACDHPFAMILGDDTQINADNDELQSQLRSAIKEWTQKGPRSRGKKPTLTTLYGSSEIACMCTNMHCGNCTDGFGCASCVNFVKKEGTRPFMIDGKICSCDICMCQCKVLFQRKDRHKLALHTAVQHKIRADESASLNYDPGEFLVVFCLVGATHDTNL
jgi:hypothetical protein